jgi:hypothetical protein
MNNLEATVANILAEDIIDRLDLHGIGRLLAVTANDEVNALAALHFKEVFGRSEVYQLPYKKKEISGEHSVSPDLRGRRLFGEDFTYQKINQITDDSAVIKIMEIDSDDDLNIIEQNNLIPLMLIDTQNNLQIYTDEQALTPVTGTKLICQHHE